MLLGGTVVGGALVVGSPVVVGALLEDGAPVAGVPDGGTVSLEVALLGSEDGLDGWAGVGSMSP